MKQADLAKALNVSQRTMFAYELGDRRVMLPMALKMGPVVSISVDELAGAMKPSHSAPLRTSAAAARDMEQLKRPSRKRSADCAANRRRVLGSSYKESQVMGCLVRFIHHSVLLVKTLCAARRRARQATLRCDPGDCVRAVTADSNRQSRLKESIHGRKLPAAATALEIRVMHLPFGIVYCPPP